jgi:2-iminobutanoate/2-iminopropanoate deaminase
MALAMIRTDKAPAPIGPYSQAILAGGELFCSGQIAIDPATGELTGSDAAQQAEQVLRNLGAVLQAAQMDYSNVVKTTIFLLDMNDFAAVNEVYAKYFDSAKPARSTVAVAALPKGARVEIDAIAKK